MNTSILLKEQFSIAPDTLYKAWLTSEEHTAMTGGEAICTNNLGDTFSAWDGYISGTNLALNPNKEIKQAWRTTEFGDNDPDSELIIQFEKNEEVCLLTLIHNNIPDGQSDYEKGWIEHYFKPMHAYFEE